jgi:hypothetical protein
MFKTYVEITNLRYSFTFYSLIIVCTFGLFTNILNILLSLRKEIQKTTMGYYNIIMSIFNILTLATRMLFIFPTIGETGIILTSNCIRLYPTPIFDEGISYNEHLDKRDELIREDAFSFL